MKYVDSPKTVTYCEIIENKSSLSSSQYKKTLQSTTKMIPLKKFLKEPLTNNFLGSEIGSENYVKKSTHYFMRTKALKNYSSILNFSKESLIPMKPDCFIGNGLRKGDLLISKDSNIGEIAISQGDFPNIMCSGAIYKLPIKEEYSKYIFALIKHQMFREQLDILVPKGATIRHAKTLFLDCLIPVPSKKDLELINLLVDCIFKIEVKIDELFNETLQSISKELRNDPCKHKFSTNFTKYSEIRKTGRLDTGLYSHEYMSVISDIKNYKHGYATIDKLGFKLSRGQNLQVSNIGKSIYSNEYHNNFYTLILPKYLSQYGTVNNSSYLGNMNKLKTLEKGDIIFGAEGFEKGRSFVVIDNMENTITNIHGITIKQKKHDLNKGIFVKQILDYYRSNDIFDTISVGGNGGSMAQAYWDYILFPLFPDSIIKEIATNYYNYVYKLKLDNQTINELIISPIKFNEYLKSGIMNLDILSKHLKKMLNRYIDQAFFSCY